MGRDRVDEISLQVPCDSGYLIGDFLRKFALRGVPTWQIAGYKVNTSVENFGLSDGSMSSYLELLKGQLVVEGDVADGAPRLAQFIWDGKVFRCGNMYIEGLHPGVGDSLQVVLNYTSSIKSAKQNFEICVAVADGNPNGFFAVPSRHVATTQFRFDVTPIDDELECLSLKADSSVVRAAYRNAVKSLTELNL